MAADKHISAANRRRTRLSGWVLSPFQVTLALCGIVVGFLVCFGFGFLSGVWFQTQEEMLPHDAAITLADDQLERERTALSPGLEMTYHSALTSRDGAPEPKPQPQAVAVPDPKPERQPPPAEPQAPSEMKPDAAEPGLAAPSEPPVRREVSAPPKPQQAAPVAPAAAPQERFYSVQVGSFRRVEQAYRLQDVLVKKGYQARIGLSIVEGKGAWYRVRVGRYADRDAADETAQRLKKKEKIDVLVMRVSS